MTDETTTTVDSRVQQIFILLSLTFASALPTLNVTIANAVLPQVRGDLSAGLEEISWVLTANLVCTAIAMPTAGWLGMRFGQRRVLSCSVIGFTVASSMLGFADSLEEVVFWRAMQGLFGGPIPPICMPIHTTIQMRPSISRRCWIGRHGTQRGGPAGTTRSPGAAPGPWSISRCSQQTL